jgi:hypothetical protein
VVQVLMAAEQIEEAAAEDVVETLVAAEIIKEEAADEVADTLATAKAVKEAAAQDVVQTLVAAELIEQAAAAEATQALVEAEIVKESAAEEAVDALIAADIIEEDAAQGAVKAIQSSKKDEIQALYVQSAHSVTYRDGVLNLNGLAPNTLYFSDRPDRVVGHVTTEEFLNAWGEGDDSFAADPPNANLSILSETDITNVVVELTNPAMTGEGMSYSVEILEGDLPASGGPSALFIDTIGRPLSPVSVGGMHRRTRRRTRRRMRR